MIITLQFEDSSYEADLSQPRDISIPVGQVKCFHAPDPEYTPYTAGDFVGSVKEGAPVNFYNVFFNPHGNGTHTESLGHITKKQESVNNFKEYHFFSQLLSVPLHRKNNGDKVINLSEIKGKLINNISALILRTKPNRRTRATKDHSDTNPPYLDKKVLEYLADLGVKHLLVDLPSVDKEVDRGVLAGHHAFWKVNGTKADKGSRLDATITELIYAPSEIRDGLYLLNMQLPSMELDAVPSRPVLYQLRKIS